MNGSFPPQEVSVITSRPRLRDARPGLPFFNDRAFLTDAGLDYVWLGKAARVVAGSTTRKVIATAIAIPARNAAIRS